MNYQATINKNEVYFNPIFDGRKFFRRFRLIDFIHRFLYL